MEDKERKLRIDLNGTDENPFNQWGLTQNPFPQIASAERAVLAIQKLGGLPIPDEAYIRKTLKSLVSDELIDLCCLKFKKGEMVRFEVSWK